MLKSPNPCVSQNYPFSSSSFTDRSSQVNESRPKTNERIVCCITSDLSFPRFIMGDYFLSVFVSKLIV